MEEPQFTPSGTGSEPEGVVMGEEAAKITPERVPRKKRRTRGDTPGSKHWEEKRTGEETSKGSGAPREVLGREDRVRCGRGGWNGG